MRRAPAICGVLAVSFAGIAARADDSPAPAKTDPDGAIRAPWIPLSKVDMPAFDERRARVLYEDNCAACHGREGRGDGPLARSLEPRPRDLTRGVHKFRSTPTGQLPSAQDLFDTLTRGLPGTAMPSWTGLSIDDRWQLVQFVRSRSPRFVAEPPDRMISTEGAPPRTGARIAEGRSVWIKVQCAKCHGDDGRGWGEAARTQKDDQGRPIYPFNLTRGENYRVGPSVEDVFRTLFTGLDGTSMPSYEGSISVDQAWSLAWYVRALAEQGKAR